MSERAATTRWQIVVFMIVCNFKWFMFGAEDVEEAQNSIEKAKISSLRALVRRILRRIPPKIFLSEIDFAP
jgi:hypothetical protein